MAGSLEIIKLSLQKKLGQGSFATVYKGLHNDKEVALKQLKNAGIDELEDFKKEFRVMSTVRSPHIVHFYGAVLEPKLCMVLEFCTRGSLYSVISDPEYELSREQLLDWITDMTKGLRDLHKHSVLHRDFKSLNLLVTKDYFIKVCDFGLARFTTGDLETMKKMCGTFAYLAPEIYHGIPYTAASDVYSLGIVMWELAHKCFLGEYQRPYQEYTHLKFDFQILIQAAKNNLRPTIPHNCPSSFSKLISHCTHKDPASRPNIEEVLKKYQDLEKKFKGPPEGMA